MCTLEDRSVQICGMTFGASLIWIYLLTSALIVWAFYKVYFLRPVA